MRITLVLAAAAALGLAGCGGSDRSVAPVPASTQASPARPASPSETASSTPSSTPLTTLEAKPEGCKAGGPGIPAHAGTGPVPDVDGDGRADTGYIAMADSGGAAFGIKTASGATFGSTFMSAGGADGRSMLVADVDGKGTDVIVTTDGRGAWLFVETACSIKKALNPQGQQYAFDLGYGDNGTGVGCSHVAGTTGRSLVGLKLNRDAQGRFTSVTRTQVLLHGTRASNGRSDTVPVTSQGSAAVRSAQTISCGDLNLKGNGINTPQP